MGSSLAWETARITEIRALTPRLRRVRLQSNLWRRPLAGQHVDVRLTAEDGYQAQRSYSLLSSPEQNGVYELCVERLADGEVSPWFHDAARSGDEVELLGPVGGHFVWNASERQPALLVGGGSGVVPLLAMAAHHAAANSRAPMVLLMAARTLVDVPMWTELQQWQVSGCAFSSMLALSRAATTPRPQDGVGRIDVPQLSAALERLHAATTEIPSVYACGSNGFVETIVDGLRTLGVNDSTIRTERFGG